MDEYHHSSLTRQTRRGNREALLDAAEERFADLGYEATTLESIGARLGVGRSTVLYHFEGKRQLYAAVLERLFFPLLERIQAALLGPGPLRERMHDASRILVRFCARHPRAARIATRELATNSPDLVRVIRDFAKPFRTLVEMGLEEARRVGTIRKDIDFFRFVSFLVGPIIYYFAALPTYLEESLDELASPERVSALESDLITTIDTVLGLTEAR